MEHLLKDLTHRRERVEFPLLHRTEEAPQLGVVLHRLLDATPRAGGGDLEDLAREVAPAALLELAFRLEPAAVLGDLLPERVEALAAHRLGEDDRGPPPFARPERQHLPHLVQHRLRQRMIHLVDGDHVGDLHDPGLQRRDRVAGPRHQREHDRVRDREHADLALPGPHRLQEDDVLVRGVEDEQRLQGRLRQAAEVAAGAHRADEDLRVEEVLGQPDPVAEQRALGERARRVDGDDADGLLLRARDPDQARHDARLADSRRPRDADRVGVARLRIEVVHDLIGERGAVLDERDRPGERAPVAVADCLHERVARPVAPPGHYVPSRTATGASPVRNNTNAIAPPKASSAAAQT